MIFDIDMICEVYSQLSGKIIRAKQKLGHPLTEKILFEHLSLGITLANFRCGEDYVNFTSDRVAMQDVIVQIALLQLMNSGKKNVAVSSTVHCEHLIQAYKNAGTNLHTAKVINEGGI